MKSFALLLAAVAAAASSKAAYDPNLDPVYSTLTPDAPVPTDALVNATGITFGIAIATVTNETVLASVSSYQSQLLGTTTLTSQATGTASSSESSSIASASSASASETTDPSSYFKRQSIKSPSALAMTLNNTILLDSHGRVGSIVANRQFQFDGPPPQAGAIYAAGWGITTDGYLTIGDNDVFFQCLSGSFYNLYDETLGSHCSPVYLETVEFVE